MSIASGGKDAQTKCSGSNRVTSPSLSGSPPIPSTGPADDESAEKPEKPPLRTIQPTVPQLEDKKSLSKITSGGGTKYTTTGGGGVQVVLDGNGPWTDLNSGCISLTPSSQRKPSGMLGFLNKRRGRASSPKPQERGVLGREGARVVVSK